MSSPRRDRTTRQIIVASDPNRTRWLLAAIVAITCVTAAVYAPVRHHDFVTFDDHEFVTENPHVATGLTFANMQWAVANAYASAGGPLTWLSHMADMEFFGLDAGPAHVENVILHIGSALLLFLSLRMMTGATGKSAVVAVLFAVHPVHVESVAWIAERKDVLSTLFWMLTMLAYARYTQRATAGRYLVMALAFALGLLSKPMVATLPIVLLLLDIWPLHRLPLDRRGLPALRRLVTEKLPLFALACATMVWTLYDQRRIGAVADFSVLPMHTRLANAAVSYLAYIGKTCWPSRLIVYYPYRLHVQPLVLATCVATLLLVTLVAFVLARRGRTYGLVGWAWYVITLIPVAGFIQAGDHGMADRFMYVPSIGLFIAVVWGGAALLGQRRNGRVIGQVLAGLAIGGFALIASRQVTYWENGLTLWTHAIDVMPDNARAQANLGVTLAERGETDAAIAHYREATRLRPDIAETHNNLGLALVRSGQPVEAGLEYREAVRLDPKYARAHNNLANLLGDQGLDKEAVSQYREALEIDPGYAAAHVNLGLTLAKEGDLKDAIPQTLAALSLEPSHADWHYLAAQMFVQDGDSPQAITQLKEALALQPVYEAASRLLARIDE